MAVSASIRTAGRQSAAGAWEAGHRTRSRLLMLLAALGVAMVFGAPFVVMVSTALTSPAAIGGSVVPRPLYPQNFEIAADAVPLWTYFGNSLVLVVLNVGAVVLVCPLVAYALSKLRWRGREGVLLLILGTMMLPPQVTLIPVYLFWDSLGLVGTYWPLVIPYFFGVPFYIFMLRQFFLTIPDEYIDAARVDGAGELRILYRIVVPMAKPAVVTVAIFQFVATWTDFMGPLIYLNDDRLYTLSVGLYAFFATHGVQWGPLMAACVMFTTPAFLLFVAGQRYFIRGASLGGLR